MSVETGIHLTEAAAAYRSAKFELSHCEALLRDAVAMAAAADRALLLAQADVASAESALEDLATQEEPALEGLRAAAQAVSEAWQHVGRCTNEQLRTQAARVDRNEEWLQARHAAVEARKSLYEEALHA